MTNNLNTSYYCILCSQQLFHIFFYLVLLLSSCIPSVWYIFHRIFIYGNFVPKQLPWKIDQIKNSRERCFPLSMHGRKAGLTRKGFAMNTRFPNIFSITGTGSTGRIMKRQQKGSSLSGWIITNQSPDHSRYLILTVYGLVYPPEQTSQILSLSLN